jgi:AraC family transcriptional regulator
VKRRRIEKLEAGMRFDVPPAVPVVCLASPRGYDLAAILETWERLLAHARRLGASAAIDAYGILHDSPTLTEEHLCRYDACVPVPEEVEIDPPFFRDTLREGRYAVFRHAGPVALVEETYRDIYSLWLPESGLVPDDYRPLDHYVTGPPVGGSVDMEIMIRARPRKRR